MFPPHWEEITNEVRGVCVSGMNTHFSVPGRLETAQVVSAGAGEDDCICEKSCLKPFCDAKGS